MYFTGETVAGSNGTSNEDWVAVTSDLIVLLDGATARTETGCHHGAAWYTRKLGASIIAEAADQSEPLDRVLANAIDHVASLHLDCNLQHPGTPSAAVAIVRIEGDFLQYAVLGDITVAMGTSAGVHTITDQRVSQTAARERAEADRHLIGSAEKDAALVAMKHAELAAKNHEGGYWIAAADSSVVQHALYGTAPLGDLHHLAIFSDGAARAIDAFHLFSWDEVMQVLSALGTGELVEKIRAVEERDPHGDTFRRNKKSDDATVVLVRMAKENQSNGGRMSDEEGRVDRMEIARELLSQFQNNPGIRGGDTQFRDAEGRPCRASESPNWQRLVGVSPGAEPPATASSTSGVR